MLIYYFLIIYLLLFLVGGLFVYLGVLVRKKSSIFRIQIRPFECGFRKNPKHLTNFSIHFYFMRLIFLVFDVELVVLYPLVLREACYDLKVVYGIFMFIFVLVLMFFYE